MRDWFREKAVEVIFLALITAIATLFGTWVRAEAIAATRDLSNDVGALRMTVVREYVAKEDMREFRRELLEQNALLMEKLEELQRTVDRRLGERPRTTD